MNSLYEEDEIVTACLIKIVLVGDASVGKTNLISRHVDDNFDEDFEPTIGTELSYLYSMTQISSYEDSHCLID